MDTFYPLDETHDATLASWVSSAQAPDADFPLQNLPFGRFRDHAGEPWRIGVAIGDQVLPLAATGLVGHDDMALVMSLPLASRRALRLALSRGLRVGSAEQPGWAAALRPQAAVQLGLPCTIGDYTDFYVGIHHATAVGRLFRPDNPLLPNYTWVPIGYHGRSSTVNVSGTPVMRPRGQLKAADDPAPRLAACARLDYELELGLFIGRGNHQGMPVPMSEAESHLFGVALFNDWSARDIQTWEYQPLGPFLSKNFASTVSPWIVTLEALAPFRRPFTRAVELPAPLPYLSSAANSASGLFDIELAVWLQTDAMRAAGHAGDCIARSSVAEAAYWSPAQLVAHHTVNGCALNPGDLFGSGTLSGPSPEQAGSLLELSGGGKRPITLSTGEQRSFVADGDSVRFTGRCAREGYRTIGFGACEARVLPALP
jgi:fumarylacetoacetase